MVFMIIYKFMMLIWFSEETIFLIYLEMLKIKKSYKLINNDFVNLNLIIWYFLNIYNIYI